MELAISEILQFIITPITGIVCWFAGSKKRNNDFLKDLQASINLLSEENKNLLAEVVELRRENGDLLINQASMQREIELLNKKLSGQ